MSFAALADRIANDWPALARVGQLAPPGDWSIWLVCAGRGFGKTRRRERMGAVARRGWRGGPYCDHRGDRERRSR